MGRRNPYLKKKLAPKGYDSRFEYELHTNELKHLEFHPEKIPYVKESLYEPDFQYQAGSKTILVEAKGRFRDREEANKYIHVRKSLEERSEQKELIFLFQDSKKPMPFAKKRKDGTKQTMAEWAELNKFNYVCHKSGVPKWLTESSLPPPIPTSR